MYKVKVRMSLTGLSKDFGAPATATWNTIEGFYGFLELMSGRKYAARDFDRDGFCEFVTHPGDQVIRYRYEAIHDR